MELASGVACKQFLSAGVRRETGPASTLFLLAVLLSKSGTRKIHRQTKKHGKHEQAERKLECFRGKTACAPRGALQEWCRLFRAPGSRARKSARACGLHQRAAQ